MADMQMGNQIAATLAQAFEQTLQQQRSLWEQISRFARDESYRFGNRQLEHASKALQSLHDNQDVTSMISAHHDLVREMVRDYADQSMRYSEMMRNLSSNAFATAMDAGRRGMAMGQDALHAAADQAEQSVETANHAGQEMVEAAGQGMSEMSNEIAQPGNEGYVHH